MAFVPAKREDRQVIILIEGPSGSGKTYSALRLMKGIIGEGKMAVIDTENKSSAIYADEFDFYINNLQKFNINEYTAAMKEAEDHVDGLIVDSISHAWKDILAKHNKMGGDFPAWGKLTPQQDEFMQYIQSYNKPLICTVRSKQAYAMEADDKGKIQVKKVGLEPVQRNDSDYEFDIAFTIDRDTNRAKLSKCRYKEIRKYFNDNDGEVLLTEEVGELIRKAAKGE